MKLLRVLKYPARVLAISLGVLIAIALITCVVWLALWRVPYIIVDQSAYADKFGRIDEVAFQDALNAVRVPVGVSAASILAAAAAAGGVLINARNVDVARASLERSRGEAVERATQWRQEQLHRRFQDASLQLGSDSPLVRLAGAYSLAHLADDWDEQRQVCIDVLCAYCRAPVAMGDDAELQVRNAIQTEIFKRLQRKPSGGWGEYLIDLSGARIDRLNLVGPVRLTGALILDDAEISEFSYMDQVDLSGTISMNRTIFRDSFRLLARVQGESAIWLQGPGSILESMFG